MKERWKLISRIVKDVRGYAISDCGRVMRLTRGPRTHPGLILKPAYKNADYVCYYFHQVKKLVYSHLLVLTAFVGPKPKDKEGNHKDGRKKNNYYKNLEWMTSEENTQHAIKKNLWDPTTSRKSRLTIQQRRKIAKSGLPPKVLAKRYNVSQSYIRVLRHRSNRKECYNRVSGTMKEGR